MTVATLCQFERALAFALVLAAGAHASAQADFPDNPDNHWAYQSLLDLKRSGLLVGYPDGLFRGNRPASRYEMAVAVHSTVVRLQQLAEDLQTRISQTTTTNDLHEERQLLDNLRAEIETLQSLKPDLANLVRMAAMFEKELTSMGIDYEEFKTQVAALANRVGVLESKRLPIDIHGDASILAMAGGSSSHRPGITVDGRPVGVADRVFAGPSFATVGMSQDTSLFEEAAIRFQGSSDRGPKWRATLVAGNLLGPMQSDASPYPSQSSTAPGKPFLEGPTSVYFQNFDVLLDSAILGQPVRADLGRTGYAVDPYLFKRPNTAPYFDNDRWNDGLWTFTGGVVGFHWGKVALDVFGGRQSHQVVSDGVDLQPMTAGATLPRFTPGGARPIGLPATPSVSTPLPVDQHLGLNLKAPIGSNIQLDLAYIWLESNSGVTAAGSDPVLGGSRAANRVDVFGGNLHWSGAGYGLAAGYSQSNVLNGGSTVVSRDNYAWHAEASYDASRWGMEVGYREIQPLFAAPGDWGRIGLWWNPTDIRGPRVALQFQLADNLKLSGSGEWYQGLGKSATSGLGSEDRISRYNAEFGFKINQDLSAALGAELVDWNLQDRPSAGFLGGRPQEKWYNIGLAYNLTDMARLSFLWQISDYRPGTNSAGGPVTGFGLPTRDGRASGNLLTSQLTIKF